MPALIPHRFLLKLAHPCPYVKGMPKSLELPETARLRNYAELDGGPGYADLRLAWNEFGLGVSLTVEGKKKAPEGDADKPRTSDGLSLWIDTRDARTSHRASRFCHSFHLLPSAGGDDKDEPAFVQTPIARALQDAPIAKGTDVTLQAKVAKGGYIIRAFLPAAVLAGFDPEQHPRWGVYYHLRDRELGDEYLSVNGEFPFGEDPSLWDVLELVK
jgi:hypothetical protein